MIVKKSHLIEPLHISLSILPVVVASQIFLETDYTLHPWIVMLVAIQMITNRSVVDAQSKSEDI